MNDYENDVMTKAIKRYGSKAQLDKAIEEAGELIVAIAHYRCDKATDFDVLDECADNIVMAHQVATILGYTEDELEKMIAQKLDRLHERMDIEEEKEAEYDGIEEAA